MDLIYERIIKPLGRYLEENEELEWWQWKEMKEDVECCCHNGQISTLHSAMIPFYEMYWGGDFLLYDPKRYKALELVKAVIEFDEDYAVWASSKCLISLTELWIENGSVRKFMDILERLIGSRYDTDWGKLYDNINEQILQLEVTGESISGEFYCILHGFVMIMTGVEESEVQQDMFKKFREHWAFLRHLYSVMVRRIVGFNFNNFVGVINNAKVSQSCTPYLAILYSAVLERSQDLIRLGAKQKNLDKAIKDIEDVMNKTDQSNDLDDLCELLFPDEIREMLNTHRLPSYQQLRQENGQLRQRQKELLQQMQEQTQQTNEQIERMTALFKDAVEASIPVEDIKERLRNLPAYTAWDIFNNLDKLLRTHKVWRKYDVPIHDMLQERLNAVEERQDELAAAMKKVAERPTYGEYYNYQNGSTHDDKRQQLSIEPKDKKAQIKRLTNE